MFQVKKILIQRFDFCLIVSKKQSFEMASLYSNEDKCDKIISRAWRKLNLFSKDRNIGIKLQKLWSCYKTKEINKWMSSHIFVPILKYSSLERTLLKHGMYNYKFNTLEAHQYCETILMKTQEDPRFLRRTILTNECKFSRVVCSMETMHNSVLFSKSTFR